MHRVSPLTNLLQVFYSLYLCQEPWSHITLGVVTALPPAYGNTIILTIVYRFSRAAHLVSFAKVLSSKETAELLIQHVFSMYSQLMWSQKVDLI